jgi:hypothetical protein
MLIATVGSSQNNDKLIAQQMKDCAHLPLTKWQLSIDNSHSPNNIDKRVKMLSLLAKPAKNEILLLQSIEFAEEAEIIREAGGFVWHMENGLSNYIPMLTNDILVTTNLKQSGTYIAVRESLHLCRRKGKPTRKEPKAHVPWHI